MDAHVLPLCVCACFQVLKKICWYAVLAPSYSTDEGSSSDVATLIATTAAYKQLGDLPLHQQLLTSFTNPEIVRWGLFEAQYGAEITAEVSLSLKELWSRCLYTLPYSVPVFGMPVQSLFSVAPV
jgi:hypothetical protein